jgi:D-xylose 1-dehydrogenase (NADP+, D-xylono-1,5-lactone-forming)
VTRWGLLSTARINRRIVAAAQKSEEIELLAVASRERARAEEYARANRIGRAYGSYAELLADEDVEALYIPLPNSMHVEWSVRALEAGKHVLCEKPLARTAADAERAFEAAERTGRLLEEAFMYRHNPQTLRVKALVDEGAVGRVRLVRALFSFPVQGERNIRLLAELDGGALTDVGCYCVSGARLLCGEPEVVSAEAVTGPTGVDEVFAGLLRFPGGVLAQVHCGLVLPFQDELEVIGEDGALFVDDPWLCWKPGIELRRGEEVERIPVEPADSYRLELERFGAAMRGEETLLLGREWSVAQARVLEALHRSAAEGVPVTLG